MAEDSDFERLTAKNSSGAKPRRLHGHVLKKKTVSVTDPMRIKPNTASVDDPSSEMVEPIIEEGTVVGLYFTCSCGRTSEIRFELDHS